MNIRSCSSRLSSERIKFAAVDRLTSLAEGLRKVKQEAKVAESKANTMTAGWLLENVSSALKDEHSAVTIPVVIWVFPTKMPVFDFAERLG
jgi:hypothetical protein